MIIEEFRRYTVKLSITEIMPDNSTTGEHAMAVTNIRIIHQVQEYDPPK